MKIFKKIFPVFCSGTIFGLVIWLVQPPQILTQASPFQLIALFVPLFIFIFSVTFLIFKSIPIGIVSGFIVILLLVLQALNLLNIITLIVIIIATFFITKSLKKEKKTFYQAKIPKLSQLKKQ